MEIHIADSSERKIELSISNLSGYSESGQFTARINENKNTEPSILCCHILADGKNWKSLVLPQNLSLILC